MQQEIIDFINSQKVCVLAVEMMDGSPHAATVHFAFDPESQTFYFQTTRSYRKCEALFGRPESRATLVVGTDENTRKTFQVDGLARILPDAEKERYDELYFGKFPKKKEKAGDPESVSVSFTPKWWRYTSFDSPGGKLILTSEDN